MNNLSFFANDNNMIKFIAFLPDLIFYILFIVFLYYLLISLKRTLKIFKNKNTLLQFNKLYFWCFVSLISIGLGLIVAQFCIRFIHYRGVTSPVYVTKELYIYLIPWFLFLITLITLIIFDILLANFIVVKADEHNFYGFKESISKKDIIGYEEKNQRVSVLIFKDILNDEDVKLLLFDKKSKSLFS